MLSWSYEIGCEIEGADMSAVQSRDIERVGSPIPREAPFRVVEGSDRLTPKGAMRPLPKKENRTLVLRHYSETIVNIFNSVLSESIKDPTSILSRVPPIVENELRLSFDPSFTHTDPAYGLDLYDDWQDGKLHRSKGYSAFRDTAKAVLETLCILRYTKKDVALNAPPQSGKTTVFNKVAQLGKLMISVYDIPATLVLCPYGKGGPYQETKSDFLASLGMGGNLMFEQHPDVSVKAVNGKIEDWYIKRNSLRQIKRAVDLAKANGHEELWVILDEADYGSNEDGVWHDFLRYCNENSLTLRIIAVSATHDEYSGLGKFEDVFIEKTAESGYHHFNIGKRLGVHGASSLGKLLGIPDLNLDITKGK